MGASVTVREVIEGFLKGFCDCVYYRKAKRASGTYLVWYLDKWTADEVGSDMMLEVHIMSRGQTTNEIDDLADEIWEALDHMYYIDENVEINVYQNTRDDVEEDDLTLLHRRLVFSMRVFQ